MAQPKGKYTGLPMLSGHYNQGYLDALMYIKNNIEQCFFSLKLCHKRATAKQLEAFIDCCIENRDKLREDIDGFIRYSPYKDCWEFFSPNQENDDAF